MPSIGPAELVLVFVIALVVLGPRRLPEVGRQVGRMIREFRSATTQIRTEMGVDDIAADVRDLRASIGVDDIARDVSRDVGDVKSSFRIDAAVKDADATAKAQAAGGAADDAGAPSPVDDAGVPSAAESDAPVGDDAGAELTAAAGALFAAPVGPDAQAAEDPPSPSPPSAPAAPSAD